LKLKRTFDPPIFWNATEPACPNSEVRIGSYSRCPASGLWK